MKFDTLLARCVTRVVYHLPKKNPGNFGWNVNGKTNFRFPNGNFRRKREFLKGSPKFPNGISKRKIVFHLLYLPVPGPANSCANSQTSCRLPVNQSELHKWQMLISNGISHLGGFAYHLHSSGRRRREAVGKRMRIRWHISLFAGLAPMHTFCGSVPII